jgi:ABC-type uncharacterized transport system permease subunit
MMPHIVLAMLTSVVLAIAAMLAVLLHVHMSALHRLRHSAEFINDKAGGQRWQQWLSRLPSVLRMERILLLTLLIGFVLLTVLVLTGIGLGWSEGHTALRFTHKTVFSLLAWVVFFCVLTGHALRGWRGRHLVRATLFGFCLLFLGYVGTHFVLSVILHRS